MVVISLSKKDLTKGFNGKEKDNIVYTTFFLLSQ
jgi:hypothetical protein